MPDAQSIPRRPRDPEETEFDALRAAGIRHLEKLSGEKWTDYNLHDPGITILEHLCFGLTDLLYRTDFEVEDHLSDPDGTIDFEQQALFRPEAILPCRPITPQDYRKTLLSCIAEVDDAWVRPWPWASQQSPVARSVPGGPGLYHVLLRPSEAAEGEESRIIETARKLLAASRNLGEDVAALVVADRDRYHLVANVDIAGARPVSEILTDIYRTAEAYVSGQPRVQDLPTLLRQGEATLDQLLEGPGGCDGGLLIDEPDYDPETLVLADLVLRIQGVEGVRGVRDLHLVRHTPDPSEEADQAPDAIPRVRWTGEGSGWSVPFLATPGSTHDHGGSTDARPPARVTLWRQGEALEEPEGFGARYQAARGGHRLDRQPRTSSGDEIEPPAGTYRDLSRYRSIQEHLPSIYGVNDEGVPDSAPEEVWMSAYRLKAYLLLPEQLMADHLMGLARLPKLFSTGEDGAGGGAYTPTYRSAVLGSSEIPGFQRMYGEADAEGGTTGWGPYLRSPAPHLARSSARHDETVDRRSRLQDHMLAVFGESLAPRSQRGRAEQGAMDEAPGWLVRSRARLLTSIPEITRDRGGAADELDPDGPPSGFKTRVALLLGVRPNTDFFPIEHVLLRPVGETLAEAAWRSFYGLRVSVLFPGWLGRTRDDVFRRRAEDVVARSCPAHVVAECFWLSKERMTTFAGLRRTWRARRSEWLEGQGPDAPADASLARPQDEAASELARFLWAERRANGA